METLKILFVVVLILLVIVIFKWGKSVDVAFNNQLMDPYKEPNYIVNADIYNKYKTLGITERKANKILICGCVRDVAKNIGKIEKNIEFMGSLFKDYRCLIVENDSSDATRKLLLDLTKRNPKITILGCGGINEDECKLQLPKTDNSVDKQRMDKMALVRNVYLEYIKANKEKLYSDYKYSCVWDLDIVGVVYKSGIENTMGYFRVHDSISAMCANCYYKVGPIPVYYDTYAHLEKGDEFDVNYKLLHDIKTAVTNIYVTGEYPKEVESCFSGFTMYRLDDMIKSKYDSSEDEESIQCEHTYLHRKLEGKCMVNPSLNFYMLNNEY